MGRPSEAWGHYDCECLQIHQYKSQWPLCELVFLKARQHYIGTASVEADPKGPALCTLGAMGTKSEEAEIPWALKSAKTCTAP